MKASARRRSRTSLRPGRRSFQDRASHLLGAAAGREQGDTLRGPGADKPLRHLLRAGPDGPFELEGQGDRRPFSKHVDRLEGGAEGFQQLRELSRQCGQGGYERRTALHRHERVAPSSEVAEGL